MPRKLFSFVMLVRSPNNIASNDGYMSITSPIDPAIIPKRICLFKFKL